MSEYMIGVFAVCLVSGVMTLLSHSSGKMEKVAIGLISLYIIISPIADSFKHFDVDDWLSSLSGESYEIESGYGEMLESAFAEGVERAVAEKFSLDREHIRARVYGFDSEKLWAEKIRVTLSGTAALADYKAVEKYLNSLGIGECELEIEIG